jgi:cell division protein FtsX
MKKAAVLTLILIGVVIGVTAGDIKRYLEIRRM